MILGLAEPETTAVLLVVFGLLMATSVLFNRAMGRLGIPVVLGFIVLGMLGGSEGIGGLEFDNFELGFRLGTVALILILFDGGLNSRATSIRRTVRAAGVLATVGVAGTAGVMAVIGRLLGLNWPLSLLIGSIVSSTDAAAVFAVLRGGRLRVKERVGSTLELESCVNDPMAVILTITLVDAFVQSEVSPWRVLIDVPVQLLVGAAVGFGIGLSARWVLGRVQLSTVGLYPVGTLAAAFLAFGVATLAYGSGFLAVFVAGAILGNGPLPYRAGLTRVHDSIAWLCQVGMFVMLGLLVFPSELLSVAGVGLALGAGLTFVARPLVVALCLWPFRWKKKEVVYASWVGIRGAVPIILGTVPVLAGLEGGEKLFHLIFFIVVFSAVLPGMTIVPVTRWLGLDDPEPATPAAALEMHSLARLNGEIRVYHVEGTVAVCGARLSEIPFPDEAAVLLVVRGEELLPARGGTRIEAGDFVYIFCRPEDEPRVGLLFGRPTDE